MAYRTDTVHSPSAEPTISLTKKLYGWVGDTSCLDVSDIGGNVDTEVKQTCLGILKFFVGTAKRQVYGAQVGERLKFVEMNIWGEGATCFAQTVFEITVEKDMCNTVDILHGGCAAYMVDPCTVASLILLGTKLGIDGSGFSQAMNLIWHNSVKRGSKIKIVSTSMSAQGRIRTARCEIWNGEKLCVTAVHSTINPGGLKAVGKL